MLAEKANCIVHSFLVKDGIGERWFCDTREQPCGVQKCFERQAGNKMKIENVTHAKVTSTKRIEQNLVNAVAMREAVVNCIVHNDFTREIPPVFEIFSDRIGMTTYGGLIPGQSEEDFFSCSSMPRNRELMRVFKDLGLVEQLGSGMSRIIKAYDKSVFEISDHFIKVVLPFDGVTACGREPNREPDREPNDEPDSDYDTWILSLIDEDVKITQNRLVEKTGLSASTVKRVLARLKDDNRLERIGNKRSGFWKILR